MTDPAVEPIMIQTDNLQIVDEICRELGFTQREEAINWLLRSYGLEALARFRGAHLPPRREPAPSRPLGFAPIEIAPALPIMPNVDATDFPAT